MFCPSFENVDVVKISVSPRREHDFKGFEGLKIPKQSSKNYVKYKPKKEFDKNHENTQFLVDKFLKNVI